MRIGPFLSIKKEASVIRGTPHACLMTIKHEMSVFDAMVRSGVMEQAGPSGQVRPVWEPASHTGGGYAVIPDRDGP